MNGPSSHAMQVVKREEKETRLLQFVLSEIAAGRVELSGCWRVTALSFDSPVVAALRRVVAELGGSPDLEIRIVIASGTAKTAEADFAGIGAISVRRVSSSRLLDAHEQLVIGSRSSWTGDCMRRNPRERDAFETFGGGNEELANWACKSFERLWQGATPFSKPARGGSSTGVDTSIDGIIAGDSASSTILAATSRH